MVVQKALFCLYFHMLLEISLVTLISDERGGGTGIEDWIQTLVTAARAVFSKTVPQESPPPPLAKPAVQTEKQREPLGSNIHLLKALILPAPSRVTVSKAP